MKLACVLMLVVGGAAFEKNDDLANDIKRSLIKATEDGDADVRYGAFFALSRIDVSPELEPTYRRGLDDQNSRVAEAALGGLVRVLDDQAKRELLTRAVEDPKVAKVARYHLIAMGDEAIPAVLAMIQDDDRVVLGLDLLEKIRSKDKEKRIVPVLITRMNHQDGEVREKVVQLLAKYYESIQARATQVAWAARTARAAEATRSAQEKVNTDRYLKYATAYLSRYDKDKDGKLSVAEREAMSKDYSGADKNGDNFVTPKELAEFLQR